jgi:hypothetical protein
MRMNEQGAHTTSAAAFDVEVQISDPFYFYLLQFAKVVFYAGN